MVLKLHKKNDKALNLMLLLSIVIIAFHVYLTHMGLSPFRLL